VTFDPDDEGTHDQPTDRVLQKIITSKKSPFA
jgi:hypothetical protein